MEKQKLRYIINRTVALKLCGIAISASGCSGVMAADTGDHLLLYGDAESIRAFGDWQNGINAGFQDRSDSPYWELRRKQTGPKKALSPAQLRGQK